MTTTRIDGSTASETLAERLTIEDSVGSGLAERTREDYARKIASIGNTLLDAGQGRLTPEKLAEYLQKRFDNLEIAQSTGRSLKAAALYWLAEDAQSTLGQGGDITTWETAFTKIKALTTKDLPKRTQGTSSTKLKYFPKTMLEQLIKYTSETPKAKNGNALIAFLKANLLVGLRPNEWFSAEFFSYLHRDRNGNYIKNAKGDIQTSIAMIVDNSKTTNGRANGESREILLKNISDNDLATLMHMQELVRSYMSKHTHKTAQSAIVQGFFNPLQQTMTKALKRLGYAKNSLPTTYSTRHQAVANAKFSGLGDREIAAMFGHASTSTSKRHYGKKNNGWMKISFRPSVESIDAVPVLNAVQDNATKLQRLVEQAKDWNSGIKARSGDSGQEL